MQIPFLKALTLIVVVILVSVVIILRPSSNEENEKVFQVGTMQALLDGDYDGRMTIGELLDNGDTGLGTFESIDGEMIVLGGVCYQVTYDGKVHVVSEDNETPFATVTYWSADLTDVCSDIDNYSELQSWLSTRMGTSSTFIAFKLTGTFNELTVRSVPPASIPYPPLVDVINNQSVFNLSNITGTLVGLYSPSYIGGIEAAGFHFHFISSDRMSGGHVLDMQFDQANVLIDLKEELDVVLA